MSHPCGTCTAPITDTATICHQCNERLRQVCVELPEIDRELETTALKLSRMGSGAGGADLPFDPVASQVRSDLRGALAGWCRILHDDHGVPIPHDTIDDMAHTIATSDIRLHEAGGECLSELVDLRVRALRAVDYPEETITPVGACPQGGEGWRCEGEVRITVRSTEACQSSAVRRADRSGRWRPSQRCAHRGNVARLDKHVLRFSRFSES